MNIAFVTSESYPVPPVRGGAVEHWIYEVARKLQRHNVFSFCTYEPLLEHYSQNEGFKLFMYKRGLLGKILLCTYKLPFKNSSNCFFYLPYSLWCSWKIRKLKVDIIHVHSRPQFIPILRMLRNCS